MRGSSEIVISRASRPTSLWSRPNTAVIGEQIVVQVVKTKLIATVLPLTRSEYSRTGLPS